MQKMVKAENIVAGYSNKPNAIDGVNFYARQGEIMAIIGPNGSGKSTLAKVITGDINATEGILYINGKDIRTLSRRDIAKNIAVVEQNVPEYRGAALQYIIAGRLLKGNILQVGNSKEDIDVAKDVMHEMGINKLAQRPLNQLSGGERQLCTIARAMIQDTPIVVLDEPTTGLDITKQIEVIGQIKKMREKGKTIICIIHDINIACNVADKILMMRDGEQIAYGDATEVATEYNLTQTMGVEMCKVHVNDKNTAIFVAQNLLNICEKV